MTGTSFATLTIMPPFCTKSFTVAIPKSGSPSMEAVVPAPVMYRHSAPAWSATWALIPVGFNHAKSSVPS